jgi:broad specificity polyphosphatase/5'/3'-nucleotidase SurE
VWEDGYCDFVNACNVARSSSISQLLLQHHHDDDDPAAMIYSHNIAYNQLMDQYDPWNHHHHHHLHHHHQQQQQQQQQQEQYYCLQPQLFFKMSHDVYSYGEG